MVFGYSSNAFVRFSLTEAIEKIARLGYGGLEIMCDRPHLYPPDFDDADVSAVRDALQKYNLKVTNLNCFTLFAVGDTYLPSWIEPDGARREIRVQHTLDCLRVADLLGCRNISVPPGGPLDGTDRKAAEKLFHRGLEQVMPLAEKLGIHILIEPEPELLIENSREFRTFMQDVKSEYVGLNFDIGHFFCVGEDPSEAFESLSEWIGHVHLEDIAADRVHEHLIPGQGAIAFREVFRTIKRMGYTGDICLELYPYVDSPEAAGRESLAHLTPIFREAGLDLVK
ncbi:xylose isomerase [Desulfonema ishimotonii]|uniref:Xylose isomerase n=1 Tax=Desulfonema ishimotonii TaxID=45657 RepID=A0A401FQ38_9BACT|nr:sugar phosphate isomerase/epimerase family protein [Desulfonema ishimotonii]GBC59104.1 xylose isomerase [Desulfonema ishimotonii]